ncbi:uncharacterized protein L3040_000749 [Drepanopeziza brunnea f. sp. 'multigermtubi']|uniref:uncharacterized protein n=1 Tax=Drepanopeziza brunnea f. sp. 'multigermtubi' TaxID=698441 RepID=UPI00238A242F|nr:hypothetical protein L3040_000749 [Drepanopeziza brunnea f. sp. 'multigermtubi']
MQFRLGVSQRHLKRDAVARCALGGDSHSTYRLGGRSDLGHFQNQRLREDARSTRRKIDGKFCANDNLIYELKSEWLISWPRQLYFLFPYDIS